MQTQRLGEQRTDARRVEPRASAALVNEVACWAHAEAAAEALHVLGKTCQGIEQMRYAHEAVIAARGIEVECESVLVVRALVLLHQEARLDAPTVAGGKVAAREHVGRREWAPGQPGMAGVLVDKCAVRIYRLPGLLANHHMYA